MLFTHQTTRRRFSASDIKTSSQFVSEVDDIASVYHIVINCTSPATQDYHSGPLATRYIKEPRQCFACGFVREPNFYFHSLDNEEAKRLIIGSENCSQPSANSAGNYRANYEKLCEQSATGLGVRKLAKFRRSLESESFIIGFNQLWVIEFQIGWRSFFVSFWRIRSHEQN